MEEGGEAEKTALAIPESCTALARGNGTVWAARAGERVEFVWGKGGETGRDSENEPNNSPVSMSILCGRRGGWASVAGGGEEEGGAVVAR